MFGHRRVPRLLSWFVLLTASLGFGQTQISPQITQPIDDSVRFTVHGSVHPATRTSTDLGAASPSEPMNRMLLVLKPSSTQEAALRTLIEEQQMKNSPSYHKWLAPAQFAAQFGPASADIAKIASWLQQEGFTNIKQAQGGRWIEFSGTANAVETAFQTSMHKYQTKTTSGTEEHIANATEISIPQAIAPVVSGVLSLNNFVSQPEHTALASVQRNSSGKLVRVSGNTTSTDGNGNFAYYLAPADVQKIYNAAPLVSGGVDGTGVSIAIIGRTDIELSDVQAFRTIFGLPQNDPNIIVNGTDPGTSFNDQAESSLDVEWAGAIAPKATINFVSAASTNASDGVFLAATYAVENNVSPILSISYGSCENLLGPSGNQFVNALWEQAAAEGISVFASSGDGGAGECDHDTGTYGPSLYGPTVNGVASTPFNVAVGGTQFNENGMWGQYWDANDAPGT